MMETYRAAIERRIAAEEELQEQVSAQNTPEMVAKVNECKEAERQLKSIEERLGLFNKFTVLYFLSCLYFTNNTLLF